MTDDEDDRDRPEDFARKQTTEPLSVLMARVLASGLKSGAIADAPKLEKPLSSEMVQRQHMLNLGWPERPVDFALKAYESQAIGAMRTFADRKGIIVLAGEKGCGKTVAAAWWAMRLTGGARFMSAAEFARMSRYGEQHHSLLGGKKLVLDDLGAEYADNKARSSATSTRW